MRRTCLAAYGHQDLPFDVLVDALNPPRPGARHPFFEVMVEHVAGPTAYPTFEGVTAEALDTGGGSGPWALSLEFHRRGDCWWIDLEFDAARFDTTTAERILGGLENLLGAALSQPEGLLSHLSVLSPAQRHQLQMEWPQSGDPTSSTDHRFPQRFAQRAEEAPQAIALVAPTGAQLSYGALRRQTETLAALLRSRGVGPEAPVGVLGTREVETVVRILAILRAGGAYVPLDPHTSSEARWEVLKATRAVRWFDEDGTFRGMDTEHRPPTEATPSVQHRQLAYILTTSGTSGTPRAVGVEHRSLAWYSRVAEGNYALIPGDRVLQSAPLTFDISVEEIFPTFAAGATLVLRDDDALGSPNAFWNFCARHAISFASLPTTFWHRLAESRATPPVGLRRLVIGGEAARPDLLRRWHGRFDLPLFDTYGPTETTVVATLERTGLSPAGLGRPLAGVTARVLDQQLCTVPYGAAGELVLGGSGLARGYLGRTDATAVRFVPDPFSEVPGTRLYRTGDRVRWLADGRLQFLGRLDREMKIRGYRVHPDAVEDALRHHPAVRDVAVDVTVDVAGDVRHGADGHRLLTAWLVADGDAPHIPALRSFLRSRLPEWMVPTAWHWVDELPLTPHGKVNYRALSTPGSSTPTTITTENTTENTIENSTESTEPRTALEAILADAWRRALGRDAVGVEDDFFALGGDSILAIRAAALARQQGFDLTPADVLRFPTVASLARAHLPRPQHRTQAQPHVTSTAGENIPLTPIQHWFFGWSLAQRHHFNQSYLLELTVPPAPWILDRALARLLEQHDSLGLRFTQRDGTWRQFHAGRSVPPQTQTLTLDLSHLPPHRTAAALAATTAAVQGSLHLTHGPLLRLAVLRLPEEGPTPSWRLLFVVHHLAVDGVSWPVLLGDLERLYLQIEAGHSPDLPPPSTSFRTWAETLAQQADSASVLNQAPHWLEVLGRREALPVDHHPADGHRGTLEVVTAALSAEDTTHFLHRCAHLSVRSDALLLTALARAFEPLTGTGRLLVELEDHGRVDLIPGLDLSRTVGWFTATYPLHLMGPQGDDSASQLFAIDSLLRSVPSRGVGYSLLRYLSPETPEVRRLRQMPPPEVSFNYLGQLDPTLTGSSLFRPAEESAGPEQGDPGALTHSFDINCRVEQGRLVADWSYNEALYLRETVEELARRWFGALRRLADDREILADVVTPMLS